MGIVQDSLLATFKFTRRDTFLDRGKTSIRAPFAKDRLSEIVIEFQSAKERKRFSRGQIKHSPRILRRLAFRISDNP